MPIFPHKERIILKIYRCPVCKGAYRAVGSERSTTCCVMHEPGTCCHYGEDPVTNEQIHKLEEVLRDNWQERQESY